MWNIGWVTEFGGFNTEDIKPEPDLGAAMTLFSVAREIYRKKVDISST